MKQFFSFTLIKVYSIVSFFWCTDFVVIAQKYPGYDDDDHGGVDPSPSNLDFPNGFVWGCTSISSHLPFCDMSLSVEERLDDLIFRLSFDEKLSLLSADLVNTGVDACTSMDGGVL